MTARTLKEPWEGSGSPPSLLACQQLSNRLGRGVELRIRKVAGYRVFPVAVMRSRMLLGARSAHAVGVLASDFSESKLLQIEHTAVLAWTS